MCKIDVVVPWVDCFDDKWEKDYLKYATEEQQLNKFVGGKNRYKPQETFKYFFRGIEKYAPWVNRVFLVTYGHLPIWLNTMCDKLVIVKHSDFIPEEYLPTFNSNTILLNLHRIRGLSEQFILFNDDTYLTNFCKESIFFKKGRPRDMAVLNPVIAPNFDPFWDMMLNNTYIINKYFNKKEIMAKHFFKWFSLKYGIKNIVRNISFIPYHKFPGFYDPHLPNALLKSTFDEIWRKEYNVCHQTCLHKFRSPDDITDWTMRYWQLVNNIFLPINKDKIGTYTSLSDSSFMSAIKDCKKKRYKVICFNDDCDDMDLLLEFFNSKFNKKSCFEK